MYQFPDEFRKAYELMTVPIVIHQFENEKVIPLLVSDGFCQLTGLDREKALKMMSASTYDRVHPDDAGKVAKVSDDFAHHRGNYDQLIRCRHEDGYHLLHVIGHWQTMPGGTELAFLTYTDVSASQKAIEDSALKYLLFQQDQFYKDPLTGLPNINYMHEFADERVGAIRADGKTPVLIYSDVVSMQFYNNQYGLAEGDKLILLIAHKLQKYFPDALLSRGADDHFVLLDAYVDEQDLAQRLTAVDNEVREEAHGNTSGIQVGVCVFNQNTVGMEAVDHAKNALKRIGSDLNTVYKIYSQMADEQYWGERYIVQNLDLALQEGWIKVFYQGIGRVKTDRTACFEALARWNDPNRGTISPGEFIPVLEKYHLLYKLDLYMVEQVCREVPLRAEASLPLLPVSINFAAQDFDYKDIPEEIEALYLRYNMDKYVSRNCFIVEITERDIATASERFQSQLRRLREMGYQLWLDDFGSGYSSLNVFSRFEIDLIKFDMALIQDLDSRGGLNRKIIKAMIEIAHDMQIHTLAEGIETPEQRQFLRDVGCELSQGFLYRRPESLSAILFKIANGMIQPSTETPEEREQFGHFDSAPEVS
jgi:EAL domain-containing protein (putative c-di-GMP-specific phosphodiesterase class I)/GGDEF domain-containing protein